jgi:sortase A
VRRLAPILLLGALGLWQAGSGAWLLAKAELAQWLLERAWTRNLAGQTGVRPWPWADTWPVARLRVPRLGLSVIVLHGDSGRSLAFGPGLAPGSARPGGSGTTLISAHRDTHFRWLEQAQIGDVIELETASGLWRYVIESMEVLDTRDELLRDDPLGHALVLATCYPFHALVPGGPLRYVVRAELGPRDGV